MDRSLRRYLSALKPAAISWMVASSRAESDTRPDGA
jgi:hypothetical protein